MASVGANPSMCSTSVTRLSLPVEGMTCASCVGHVGRADITFTGLADTQAAVRAIERAGYTVREETIEIARVRHVAGVVSTSDIEAAVEQAGYKSHRLSKETATAGDQDAERGVGRHRTTHAWRTSIDHSSKSGLIGHQRKIEDAVIASASHPKVITLMPMAPPITERAVRTRAVTAGAWWTRWLMPRRLQSTQSELAALDGLTIETLKDIGAPEWIQERARRAQELSQQGGLLEWESLHWR